MLTDTKLKIARLERKLEKRQKRLNRTSAKLAVLRDRDRAEQSAA